MHTPSFYRGLLYELQKTAQVLPPKKKSLLSRALPAAALGAGLAGAGYLGYKALGTPKPSGPPANDFLTYAKQRSANPEYTGFEGESPATPNTFTKAVDRVTQPIGQSLHKPALYGMGGAAAAGMLGKVIPMPAPITKGLGTFNKGVGRIFGPVVAAGGMAEMQRNPMYTEYWTKALDKGIQWLTGGRYQAHPSIAPKAVKTGLTGLQATAMHPTIGLGTMGGFLGQMPLELANVRQLNQAGNTSQLSDIMRETYKGMKGGYGPEQVAKAREAANIYFTNPEYQKSISSVTNPDFWRRAHMSTYGTTQKQNTMPLQALMNKMRRELGLPEQAMVDM